MCSPPTSRKSPPSPQASKRKVHFRVCAFSYFEPGLEQEIALDRQQDLYYTDDDYDKAEDESRETLRRMNRSKSAPAQLEKNLVRRRNLSSRGLEERTTQGARESLRIQMKAVRLILMVQKFQRENGNTDPETIGKRYRKLAAKSAKTAHLRGLQDQMFAEWIAEGCPEEPDTSDTIILTESKVLDIRESVYRGMNLDHHRRSQSPHFNFLCGPGIGQFFKHKQLFEVVDAR
jgi:hypothetical protein